MRRLLSILLVAALAFSMVPTALAADFNVTVSNGFIDETNYEPEYLVTSREEMAQQVHISGWPPENVAIDETYDVTIQADFYTEDGVPCVMDGSQKFVLESVTLRYGRNKSTQDTDPVKDEVWNVQTGGSSGDDSGITVQVTTHEPSGTMSNYQNQYKRLNQNRLDLTWRLDPATKATPVTVKYDFYLPEGAHAYRVGRVGDVSSVPYAYFGEDYINGDKLDGLKNTGIIVLKGAEIPCYPEGTLNGDVGLIGGVPDLDKNSSGNIIKTYYSFDGWTIRDGNGTVYTEGTMPEAEDGITLVAQWTKITDEMLDAQLDKNQKAVEVPFADPQKTGTDAMISQHSSASKKWSTEDSRDNALKLADDREVYYKATLSMNPLIAEVKVGDNLFYRNILANRKITDPTFASFDIKVQLDEQLEPVADNTEYVTFKFTCTFLQPAGTADSGKNVAVIKDQSGETIYAGLYNIDGDSYVYTVPASILKSNPTFSIPMEWKPTTTGYSAAELTKEISLEVAATRVAGEKEAWVDTTGVITGSIDLSKAGVQETDVVSYLIAFDKTWKDAFLKDDMTYMDILAAAKQMKDAMKDITLEANTVWAHVDGPEPEPIEPDWKTSKSKTATNLDDNYESQVTLSLPAEEKQPSTDVVFVLDRSDSSKDARKEINTMLGKLAGIVEKSDATIKVGVVNFRYRADKQMALTELTTENLEEIQAAIGNDKISGTNIEAGIKAGVAMLEADTETVDENKYLVLLTDGISHAWNGADDQIMTLWGEGTADAKVVFNGANSYYSFDSVKSSFEEIYAMDANDEQLNSPYEVPVYGADGTVIELNDAQYDNVVKKAGNYIKEDEYNKYLSGTEKGVYTAAHAYADAAAKYKCISLYWTIDGYPVAKEFMEWTATQGKAYDITDSADLGNVFDSVQKDILYVVDKGSTVEDYMGNGKDEKGNDYNFDFVTNPDKLILKVGNTTYVTKTAEADDEDALYYFVPTDGEDTDIEAAPFVLHYYKDSSKTTLDEHFVWDINVPIKVIDPVSLTYTVKLRRPATEEGSYGTFDSDGSEEYDGLYTNNSATLYPIDSKGNKVKKEEFPKPTVSYEVNDLSKLKNGFTIEKNVNGTGADYSKEFTFTVELYEADGTTPLTGEYDYIKNSDNTGKIKTGDTVKLKDSEGITIGNLPVGSKYVVTETAETNYTTAINTSGDVKAGNTATGTVVAGIPQRIQYTNTYTASVNPPTPPKEYDIDVTKSVDDSSPDVGDTVEYTVKIKNTGEKKLTNIKVNDVMKNAAGSIEVDEDDLPKGVEYKGDGKFVIDELDAGKTIIIKYTYKVKNADEDKTIKNTVTVKVNDVSDSDDATIRVREDDDRPSRPSKSSGSSKPSLDTEDHYAYIVGMPDGLVHPEAEITRAEVATIFYRLLTEESRKELWTKENPYSDVAANDWYNVAVSVMSNGGVIHGYPDGTFKGGGSITRAEFATIAAQFLSSKYVGSDRFTDINGHWAAEYINRAAAEGWIAGYPDGTFRPDQNITRAEAMTLVNAVLGRTPDKDHLLRNMIEWPDNMVESKWYYAQVQEATNSHEYERDSKKTVEDWTKLLEVRDWTEIERVWSDIYSSHNPGEVMAD